MTAAFDDLTAAPGLDPDDDATVISGRRAVPSGNADADPDQLEQTVLSAARAAEPGARAEPVETVDDDGSTVVARRESRRRRQRADAAASPHEQDGHPSTHGAPGDDDGETAQAVRTGRGRGLAATTAADVPAPLGRVARAPEASPPPSPVRAAAPVIVPRTAPPTRDPQQLVDTAAVDGVRRRRARRLAVTVIVAACVLAVAAAVALTVLALAT